MQTQKLTRTVTIIAVFGFTVGILWITSSEKSEPISLAQDEQQVETENQTQQSLWEQFIPKSLAQQQTDRRLALQDELANLIEGQVGIAEANVVLSMKESQGIGRSYEPSTACVTITPSSPAKLTNKEIESVTQIVASGVFGLSSENVSVIDNRDGLIFTEQDPLFASEKVNVDTTRRLVEDALGLTAATVQVTTEDPFDGVLFIPWLEKKQNVKLTLPRSWITKRASQIGGVQIVMDNITHIAQVAAPSASVEIVIINDLVTVAKNNQPTRIYAKQWAFVFGLVAILLSGLTIRRRKRDSDKVTNHLMGVSEEARFILSLPHDRARSTIDALVGPKRQAVLEAIVKSEIVPIIEVPTRKSSELVRCG